MKYYLYIHQHYQPQKLSLYPLDEISYFINKLIFHIFYKFYMKRASVKAFGMYFTHTFQLTKFVDKLIIFMAHALIYK